MTICKMAGGSDRGDAPYKAGSGHEWIPMKGSNVSFVCSRCGISGYLPAKEMEAGVKTSGDCDDHVVEAVMTD